MGKPKRPQKRAQYELESHPTTIDTVLESADLLLTTAQNVGEVANVPFLGSAAGLVLSILTIVQEVRDNKSAFEQLAVQAYKQVQSFTDLINHLKREEGRMGVKRIRKRLRLLSIDIESLNEILTRIDEFAHVKLARNLWQRVLYWRYDVQTIRQYRDELNRAHESFNQRSQIVLRFDMAKVDEKTDRILEHLERQEERAEATAAASAAASPQTSPAPQSPPGSRRPTMPHGAPMFDDGGFPFSGHFPGHTGNIHIPPGTYGNVHVNNVVNSGNVSTSTHNGNVYNFSPPSSGKDFVSSNPYFPQHASPASTWTH